MNTWHEKDANLDAAIKILASEPEGKDRDALTANLRRSIGSASSTYMGGRSRFARLWNWALDTEYVAVGPPPIAWILLTAAVIVFGVCVVAVLT